MPRFDLNDLLSKDKTELDKIKTAVEIYQSEDKYTFEKQKFRTENFRFFIIAILTSAISLGSAYIIETFKQSNTAKSDVKKEFIDLKKSYLSEKDKTKQQEIACALTEFENLIDDVSISKDQKKYDIICNSGSTIKQQAGLISNVDTTSEVVKTAADKIDGLEYNIQTLTQKKKTASATEKVILDQQIKEVNKQIDNIADADPVIKKAVQSSQKIELNIKQIDSVNKSIVTQQGTAENSSSKSKISWFKVGYFLQFGEYRILLQYLDKKEGIQIEVCKTKESDRCENPVLTKAWVTFDNSLRFSDDGHSYQVNLEDIDHAGKNPFKLAAYITFETLK